MTGPEHYREAERILAAAAAAPADLDVSVNVAAAQVHATLALAAAQTPRATGTRDLRTGWQ